MARIRGRPAGRAVEQRLGLAVVLVLVWAAQGFWCPPPPLGPPRPLPSSRHDGRAGAVDPSPSSRSSSRRSSEDSATVDEKLAAALEMGRRRRREAQSEAEAAAAEGPEDEAVGGMAMWELIRELERRGVVFNVLQPREELTGLLLDARRRDAVARAGAAADSTAKPPAVAAADDDSTAPPAAAVAAAHEDLDGTPASPAAAAESGPATAAARPRAPPRSSQPQASPPQQQKQQPPPPQPVLPPPVFASIADALAWAGKLSEEEIRVELEFLGVQEDFDDEPTHAQLARLLARAVMPPPRPAAAAGLEAQQQQQQQQQQQPQERAASSSMEEDEDDVDEEDEAAASLPPGQGPKSKARQARMMRELQREARGEGEEEGEGTTTSTSSSSGWRPGARRSSVGQQQRRQQQQGKGKGKGNPGRGKGRYGGEERLLDIDHARDELAALRDRAMSAFAAEGAWSPSSGSSGGSSKKAKGEGKKQAPLLQYDEDGDRLALPPGDVVLRAFDKMTRAADKALDWATRAKSMARGAMIAATTSGEDTDPRSPKAAGAAGAKKAELQKKSQALLGPRGRRWSRFGGLMARAWAESAWQVVMASASWAGGGLLPGKYVLLGAGAFSLLLRQGLGAYMATLLVVRTCSSTLRNIIEDDDAPEEID